MGRGETASQLTEAVAIVSSVFAPAIRAINALEQRIGHAEDDADAMLWEQAGQVVAQLDAGLSQRALAAQWINARTGEPHSVAHVNYTARISRVQFTEQPRPRFRDAYNVLSNTSNAWRTTPGASSGIRRLTSSRRRGRARRDRPRSRLQ